MKRLSGIFFGLILISFSAQASVCTDVTGVMKEVLFLGEPNCELAKDVSKVINDVATVFGGPTITLIMGSASDNAGFDLGHLIELPYQMIFYGQYGASYPMPKMSVITSAAHEYGHAIFHERVKKEFPQFAELIKKLAKVSDLKEAVIRETATPEQLKEASTELGNTTTFADFNKYLTAYSEFFADVVAVYDANSKSAMLSALYYDQMTNNEYNYVRMRDFDSAPSVRYESMLSEDHAKLAYVRTYVGESLWPKNRKQAKAYAEKILTAIMKVARADMKAGRSPEFREMSDNLIAELKKP